MTVETASKWKYRFNNDCRFRSVGSSNGQINIVRSIRYDTSYINLNTLLETFGSILHRLDDASVYFSHQNQTMYYDGWRSCFIDEWVDSKPFKNYAADRELPVKIRMATSYECFDEVSTDNSYQASRYLGSVSLSKSMEETFANLIELNLTYVDVFGSICHSDEGTIYSFSGIPRELL